MPAWTGGYGGKRVSGPLAGCVSAVTLTPVYDMVFDGWDGVGDDLGGDDVRFHAPGARNHPGALIGWRSWAEDFPLRGSTAAAPGQYSHKELIFAPDLGGSCYRLSRKVDAVSMLEATRWMESQERGIWEAQVAERWTPGDSTKPPTPKRRLEAVRDRILVAGAYKRKADKVQPVDTSDTDGSTPGGVLDWRERAYAEITRYAPEIQVGPYDHLFHKRITGLARGARLKPERIDALMVGPDIRPAERQLFVEMLFYREAALSWTFEEIGRIRRDVAPPQEIRTIDHVPWKVPGFPVPRALKGQVAEMIRERVRNGRLEACHGPYRNPWFLVKKKDGKHRLINAAMHINKVTKRDANLPPNVDEFSESFAGNVVASLIDFFSGYDQVELAEMSRDLTAFMTESHGLVRQTTLPQGATNSVAQFVRIVTKILEELIPYIAMPYLDDIGVHGPRTTYHDEEALPGIRRFVLEHIIWLERVLYELELAGATISGLKSQFLMPGIKVVGYVCDASGRHPDEAKVAKILNWEDCRDLSSARAFMGVCTFYRLWVKDFAIVSEPIFRLFRTGVVFVWGLEQVEAMHLLKVALTTAPALIQLDYSDGAGLIILMIDASKNGWGAVLMQLDREGKRHPCRYESGIWSKQERKYDAGKLECRGLLHALKKNRTHLYGVRFVVETDANTLVAQLNRAASDLPGALMTRWLAWIQLWDFEVRHIPGQKNGAADGLSRRPPDPGELRDEPDEDIEDFIDAEIGSIQVAPLEMSEDLPLEDSYSEDSQRIARYLTTLLRPVELSAREFWRFKRRALRHLVRGRHLFRRASKNVPLRRVVDGADERQDILRALHEESGHRGREGTYQRIAERYAWDGLWKEVSAYVRSCRECQLRAPRMEDEALHPTWMSCLWEKVAVDVVHMPASYGYEYLVLAREDVSGWVEGRALASASSAAVARFLFEDMVCRHGLFRRLVVDGGPENKGLTKAFAELYGIRRIVVSAYHPQSNGMVERGHRPIVDALSKLTAGRSSKWKDYLHLVLWADRTTVRASTGMTPARVIYGNEHVLPIKLTVPTWQTLPWDSVRTTAELLVLRAQQLERRDSDVEAALLRIRRLRSRGKEYFDNTHNIREGDFEVGMLVLLYNTKLEKRYDVKLDFRWTGPYKIAVAHPDKGTYQLQELDGTMLQGTMPGRRLKRFTQRVPLEVRNPADLDGLSVIEEGQTSTVDAPGAPLLEVAVPRRDIDRNEYEAFEEEFGDD